jgi:hypothetical protein
MKYSIPTFRDDVDNTKIIVAENMVPIDDTRGLY